MNTGKRYIKNGNEFNGLFPEVKGEFKTIKKVADLDDTIHLMKEVIATTLKDTLALSEMLKATTQKQTCSNIWNFCFKHLQYTKDEMGKEQVRRPARSWQDRTKGVDCDCMSVFIGSILTNLDISFSFRLTKYESSEFEHVYIIAHTDHGILILDAVIHEFNREVPYSAKKDISMELQYLNGFEDENEDFDQFDEIDELEEFIDNDYPIDAQGLVMDDELLGLEGRAERRAKRAARKAKRKTKRKTRKTERKQRRAEIKKLPKGQRFKARLKQGLHVLNRFNPGAALLRLGMLASMKLNLMKVPSKIRFGYWTDAEAERNNIDMAKFAQLKRIREKLEKIFFGAGGKTVNLKKAILTGKGNRDKKVTLNGLGEIISQVYDEDDLRTILGDDIYYDEMLDNGVNGLGVVATASTATAVTAAAGIIGTIASLIKKLGSVFKKGTPQAEQEIVQENTDDEEEKTRKFSFKNLVSRVKNSGIKLPAQFSSKSAMIPQQSSVSEQQFEDYSTPEYNQRIAQQPEAELEESSQGNTPKEKKGIVDWVKENPLLVAGIATVAVGGTVLAVKAMKGKKKGLSGAPKKKKSTSKPKKTVAKKKKGTPKKRRKRKTAIRKSKVKKIELL